MSMAIDFRAWTVGETLHAAARQHHERTFLRVVGDRAYSFAEIHEGARQVAAALYAHGVRAGETVCLMLANSVEAVQTWLGVNLLGAVEVSLNTGYRGASLEHALNQARARHIVIGAEYLPALEAIIDKTPHLASAWIVGAHAGNLSVGGLDIGDYAAQLAGAQTDIELPTPTAKDIASVIYTSGTSGPAKGVMMPHGQVVLLARQTAEKLRIGAEDVYYSFHPLYHMAGKFMQVLACLHAGATLVLDRTFSAEQWLHRVREAGATLGGAHGPMLEMIFAQPPSPQDRAHRLRAICSAPFPRHIAARFEERFGIRGVEVWGMTEVGIPLWCSAEEPLREGSCGKVDEQWFEFAVLDQETDERVPSGQIGQFAVRSKHPWTLMQGYMGMAEKTVEAWSNLWFHTGDLGYMDESGYVYFVGRASDRIRRRAENVSAYDIEVAALDHPAVAEAAAMGVSSEFAGDDDIKLSMVLRTEMTVEPPQLLAHLAERLPHYMVPRYLEFLQVMPRSATQKVQRAVLKQRPLNGPDVWDRKAHGIALRQVMENS